VKLRNVKLLCLRNPGQLGRRDRGTDPSKDPTVQYTTKSTAGFDEIDFTLTKSRRGQVEYDAQQSLTVDGQQKTVALNWTSPVNVAQVTLSVSPPSGATVNDTGGATLGAPNSYAKRFTEVKAGQERQLRVTYTGGTTAPGGQTPGGQTPGQGVPAASGSQTNPVLVASLSALFVAVFALFFGARRRQSQAEEYEDDYGEEEEEAPPSRSRGKATAVADSDTRESEEDSAFDYEDDRPPTTPKGKSRGERL
jgi:hypothetical protein